MIYKAVAISTLALLAAGELTNQAFASPDVATPTSAASNYVVPVEVSPASQSAAEVAPPEAELSQEFSASTPTSTQSASANTVVVPAISQSPQPTVTSVRTSDRTSQTAATATPTTSIAQSTRTSGRSTASTDLAVTATDVQVTGVSEELQQLVLNTIRTRPGGSTNQNQLDNDVATILNTGYFTDARVTKSVNRDGWNVTFQVQPVVVRSLQLSGNRVLTQDVANTIFQSQLGQPISPSTLRQGFQQVSQWYKDNGYALAQVVEVQPNRNGVVTVNVAEGVIGDINFRFLDKEGK
ncbi:MAG TPA: POTRA domain-containing protein, partial [Coleofasciculaceae cyanobacterium]